jgi:hypothetical protein
MTQTQPKIERTTSVGLARFAYEYIDAAMLVDNAKGEVGLLSQASYTPAYFLAVWHSPKPLDIFHSAV